MMGVPGNLGSQSHGVLPGMTAFATSLMRKRSPAWTHPSSEYVQMLVDGVQALRLQDVGDMMDSEEDFVEACRASSQLATSWT